MGIKTYNPYTPSRRKYELVLIFSEIYKNNS